MAVAEGTRARKVLGPGAALTEVGLGAALTPDQSIGLDATKCRPRCNKMPGHTLLPHALVFKAASAEVLLD